MRAFFQTLFPRSGDVIHPQLWEPGSGYETSKNCDWFLRRLSEVRIFENLVLDSLKTINLQICLDHEALSALSRSIVCNIVRNI